MNIAQFTLPIERLSKKFNLKLVILYGSYAKNKQNENSDIDIAILGKNIITFANLTALNNEFARIFKTKNIDVKSLHNANPLFKYEVTHSGIPLYDNKNTFPQLKSFAARDYIATCDLRNLEKLIINKRQASLKKKLYG